MKKGFTLVELSIVLVIIGLLVGGVLTGRELIEAAKVRAHINQVQKYRVAFNSFKLGYDAVPGDMKDFDEYFPGDLCMTNTTATNCNGDGDGITESGHESVRAWKQLELTELWEGTFTGRYAPGPTIDSEAPQSKLKDNLGLWPNSGFTSSGTGYYGHIPRANFLGLLSFPADNTGYTPTFSDNLNGKELYNIDSKIDDGLPLSGNVVTWNHGSCIATATKKYRLDLLSHKICWSYTRID